MKLISYISKLHVDGFFGKAADTETEKWKYANCEAALFKQVDLFRGRTPDDNYKAIPEISSSQIDAWHALTQSQS